MIKVFWCKNCLNMSTRPRISFDERGWCNACQWMEEKKTINWQIREEELMNLTKKYRKDRGFDCIVPVSGGKDGSYVAYTLKHKYKMHPLTVTVRPALEIDLGKTNLHNFVHSGFNHIHITPDMNMMRKLNKLGFIEKGFPYYGWLIAIMSAVIRLGVNLDIPLLFYGEDGEIEYGGSSESKDKALFDIDYMKRIYLEGGYENVLDQVNASEADLYFWQFPTEKELKGKDLHCTHMSYFEPWDSYRNYLIAKEHCGLQENEDANIGTFTNFSQNDQALYSLHTYLMYLKFGFGRATQDAGIEIRRGAMNREQAKNLVQIYDNQFPDKYIDLYLNYFEMTQNEFDLIIDSYANKFLFNKSDGRWEPNFEIV
jgi:N-acetyl sugar amidotransferase